jgi:hypothetical protein
VGLNVILMKPDMESESEFESESKLKLLNLSLDGRSHGQTRRKQEGFVVSGVGGPWTRNLDSLFHEPSNNYLL